MDNSLIALWLQNILGYESPLVKVLYEQFQLEEIFQNREASAFAQLLSKPQLEKLCATHPEDFSEILQLSDKSCMKIVTIFDSYYPEALKTIDNPPLLLFCKGQLNNLLNPNAIGIVGTRKPSNYGIEVTRRLSEKIAAAGITVVSGLAMGLDSEAHRAALNTVGGTIGVVANGLDICYPSQNLELQKSMFQKQLVISEYIPTTRPQKHYFLQRNRIIAGITKGLLIAEARLYSGTMSTVNHAMTFGRDIFTVPGSIYSPLSEGTNYLAANGAFIVTGHASIINHFGVNSAEQAIELKSQPQEELPISPLAIKIAEHLSFKAVSAESLCDLIELNLRVVMSGLSELELHGLVTQSAGREFALSAAGSAYGGETQEEAVEIE